MSANEAYFKRQCIPKRRPSLCISSCHIPKGFSPQVWTDIKGQAWKPERETSWGRRANRVARVPAGDVRWIWRSPLLVDARLTLACKIKSTSFYCLQNCTYCLHIIKVSASVGGKYFCSYVLKMMYDIRFIPGVLVIPSRCSHLRKGVHCSYHAGSDQV